MKVALISLFVLLGTLAEASPLAQFQSFIQQNPQADAKQVCKVLRKNLKVAEDMFREATVDQAPKGDTYGCVLGLDSLPSFVSKILAKGMNALWTGKKFNDEGTELVNKVPALGIIGFSETATAKVYRTQSVLDGKDIYVLDYTESEQNLYFDQGIIRIIRDEVREISPGIFMGPVYMNVMGIHLPTTLYFAVFTSQSGLL